MPASPDDLIKPRPGSLVAEAFEAVSGSEKYETLAAFAAHCMTNGDLSGRRPRCLRKATLHGPELVDLSSIRRTVGVGPKTEITEDHDLFYANVERIEERLIRGHQPAPFIIERRDDGWHYLLDGNHTKMALKRRGVPYWWAIKLEATVSCELEDVGAV
jgi:hypothetical protein